MRALLILFTLDTPKTGYTQCITRTCIDREKMPTFAQHGNHEMARRFIRDLKKNIWKKTIDSIGVELHPTAKQTTCGTHSIGTHKR